MSETEGKTPMGLQTAPKPDTDMPETTMIVVNGVKHKVPEKVMSGTELARLAYPDIDIDGARSLTIAYNDGPEGASSGLLSSERSIRIVRGQSFHAYLTDKS